MGVVKGWEAKSSSDVISTNEFKELGGKVELGSNLYRILLSQEVNSNQDVIFKDCQGAGVTSSLEKLLHDFKELGDTVELGDHL